VREEMRGRDQRGLGSGGRGPARLRGKLSRAEVRSSI
jgi:hypothetical protein